jgi:hypothetical protein
MIFKASPVVKATCEANWLIDFQAFQARLFATLLTLQYFVHGTNPFHYGMNL